MLINAKLPSEFDAFLAELAGEPPHVRALWRYAIFLLMIDTERAHIVTTHQDGETLHLIVQTHLGEQFEVVRPEMSEEAEQQLLEKIREIFSQEPVAPVNFERE